MRSRLFLSAPKSWFILCNSFFFTVDRNSSLTKTLSYNMIDMFCLYHFSLKCIIRTIIYCRMVALINSSNYNAMILKFSVKSDSLFLHVFIFWNMFPESHSFVAMPVTSCIKDICSNLSLSYE